MRRVLLAVFVFALLGILMALVFRHQQGYVLVSFAGWQLETSLLVVCIALVVALAILAVVWRLFAWLVFAPRNICKSVERRRRRKVARTFHHALGQWAEAHWTRAERELQKLLKMKGAPGLAYLFSARAAQNRSHLDARDRYLQQAAADDAISEVAVLATRAELQATAGQTKDAIDTLARLHQLEPRHPWGLALYGEQLMKGGEYDRLYKLLPEIKKHAVISTTHLDEMTLAAHSHRLASQDQLEGLTASWRKVPKMLRNKPEMVYEYASCLHRLKADDDAANVIRGALKVQWSGPLVELFGQLDCSDRTQQLATVEDWINGYGKKHELMMVAGRMCLRNKLWGRARSYFETSQSEQPTAGGMLELAQTYEQLNEFDQARDTYREGLKLSVSS